MAYYGILEDLRSLNFKSDIVTGVNSATVPNIRSDLYVISFSFAWHMCWHVIGHCNRHSIYLACILAYLQNNDVVYGIFSDIVSVILSDIFSNKYPDILSDLYSDMFFDSHSGST